MARALDARLAAIQVASTTEEDHVAGCVDANMALVTSLTDRRTVAGRRARRRPFAANMERLEFVVRWLEDFVPMLRLGEEGVSG